MPEQICRTCGKPIKMQIMKNTGYCREKCKEAAACTFFLTVDGEDIHCSRTGEHGHHLVGSILVEPVPAPQPDSV